MTRMETAAPARKVVASALGAALATVLFWALEFWFVAGVPGHVQGAVTTIISFALGYYVPPAARDQVVTQDEGVSV